MAAAEPEARYQLVARAAALLLVGGDALPADGGHVLHPQQVGHGRRQFRAAVFAHVGPGRGLDLVDVPASPAALGRHQYPARRAVGIGARRVRHRQDHPVDLVLGALVVDQPAGAELADGQEPGPLQILGAGTGAAAPRHERRQRQARERVTRQETLGGQVPVRVEVGLPGPHRVGPQDVELALGLVPQPLGPVPVLRRGGCALHHLGLGSGLLAGRRVQGAPPPHGVGEAAGHGGQGVGQPTAGPPSGGLGLRVEMGQHGGGLMEGSASYGGVGEGRLHSGGEVRVVGVVVEVEHVAHRAAQVQAALGQPHRVDVGPHQVLVG